MRCVQYNINSPSPGLFDQLLRPSSPTQFFTPLKAVQSPLRGTLPSPSPLNMDSLVGDVPTFHAAPAGPLSPSSMSYRTLLDSLPSQLHPKGKGGKKKENGNGASTSTTSSSRSSGQSSGAFDMLEPIERRISVRATECVFRYKQIVVKKCHRYTQIWLNTQTLLKNAINPQVRRKTGWVGGGGRGVMCRHVCKSMIVWCGWVGACVCCFVW